MTVDHLTQRLRFASSSVQLSDRTQAAHLVSIARALGGETNPNPTGPRAKEGRRIVVAIITAAILGPAGLAAASDNALPGDVLYSVKEVSEKILVLFDPEIIARHRIEELEAHALPASSDGRLSSKAADALSDFSLDHPLWDRFRGAVQGDTTPTPPEAPTGPGAADERDEAQTAEVHPIPAVVELPDGSIAWVSIRDGAIISIDLPTGWILDELADRSVHITASAGDWVVQLRADGSLVVTAGDDDDSSEQQTTATPATAPATADPDDDGQSESFTATDDASTDTASDHDPADDSSSSG